MSKQRFEVGDEVTYNLIKGHESEALGIDRDRTYVIDKVYGTNQRFAREWVAKYKLKGIQGSVFDNELEHTNVLLDKIREIYI